MFLYVHPSILIPRYINLLIIKRADQDQFSLNVDSYYSIHQSVNNHRTEQVIMLVKLISMSILVTRYSIRLIPNQAGHVSLNVGSYYSMKQYQFIKHGLKPFQAKQYSGATFDNTEQYQHSSCSYNFIIVLCDCDITAPIIDRSQRYLKNLHHCHEGSRAHAHYA